MTQKHARSAAKRSIAAGAALVTAALVIPATGAAAKAPTGEPDTRALAGPLADQTVSWETCAWSSYPAATQARLNSVPGTACATVTVPRDWKNPTDGNTITLRIAKTGTAGAQRQGIALVNPGGPGGSGLVWGPAMALSSPTLARSYDFIGFDPRGVGESTELICTYEDVFGPNNLGTKKFVEGCLDNPLTPYITTEQTAYDMDFIRVLLGENKTSYVGYSYGTWLGKWYATVFSSKVHRMLLDSATDASQPTLERTWDLQPRSRDRQFQDVLMPYMARHPEVFHMGTDPAVIRQAWERTGGNREFFGMLLTGLFILPAMYNTSEYVSAGMTVRMYAYNAYLEHNPSTEDALEAFVSDLLETEGLTEANKEFIRAARLKALTAIAARNATAQSTAADAPLISQDAGAFEAIRCQDGQWNTSEGYWDRWLKDLRTNSPFIAPLMTVPACAFWPARTSMPKAMNKTFPQTLIVQSEMDAATPYEGALATAQRVPNTTLLSVDNEGSHGIYPYGTTCVDDAVEAYFLTGTMPASRQTACQAKPLPLDETTAELGSAMQKNGKVKTRMVSKATREANEFVKNLLRDAVAAADSGADATSD